MTLTAWKQDGKIVFTDGKWPSSDADFRPNMTQNRVPFGLLLDDEKEVLEAARDAGLRIEWWYCNNWYENSDLRGFFSVETYRIAPGQSALKPVLRKASPPWDVIEPKFNYWARDEEHEFGVFSQKAPSWRRGSWHISGFVCADGVIVMDRGELYGRASLVTRPGYEPEGGE